MRRGLARLSPHRSIAVTAVAVAALLGALGVSTASAKPRVGSDASEVTHWNQVAVTTLAAVPGPNGGAPPAFAINMGMVQGAVYDAVDAIGPKQHRPYLLNGRTGARASVDAAVATAAYDVLSELVAAAPERAPFPGRSGLLSTLSSTYVASLDAIDDDSFKKQGIAVGHAAAQAMLKAREGDGRFGPSPWVSNPAPGHWQPLVSGGVPALDPTPWVGNVRPFLIQTPRSSVRRHRLRLAASSGRRSSTRSRAWAEPPVRPGPTSRPTLPGGGRAHPF